MASKSRASVPKDDEAFESFYDKHRDIYHKFAKRLQTLLRDLMDNNSIKTQSISYRVKSKSSFLEKCKRKDYSDPSSDMMDFVGMRIIVYLPDEVEQVGKIIAKEFAVLDEHSESKIKNLDVNKVGYISNHYIIKLKSARAKTTEWKDFKGIKCELQVRTVLQHAWAEIEHDNCYKSVGSLPSLLRRRFNIISGALELLDKEFQSLCDEVRKFEEDSKNQFGKSLVDMQITPLSLPAYLKKKYGDIFDESASQEDDGHSVDILVSFGLSKIKDLNKLLY